MLVFSFVQMMLLHSLCERCTMNNTFDPLTAGAAYIRVFIFILAHYVPPFERVKDKCDINQQYLKTVDLHFVKSE